MHHPFTSTLGKKKSEMPAPQARKKRKTTKSQAPINVRPITNYFNNKVKLEPRHDDEEKCTRTYSNITSIDIDEASNDNMSDICSPGIPDFSLSQFSQFSMPADMDDSREAGEEATWLRRTDSAPNRALLIERRSDGEAAPDPVSNLFRNTSRLMRGLSLESQDLLTPADQPVQMMTSAEMKGSLLHNRRTSSLPSNTNVASQPKECPVNQFLPEDQRLSSSHEIALPGCGKFYQEFKSEGRIGKGSFGEVVRCRSRTNGCVYAVKRVKNDAHHQTPECVQREAFILAALGSRCCPTIVRYFQSWEQNDEHFIVMDYCAGGALSKRLRQPMNDETLVQIFMDIGKALRFLHEQRFLHLDVKPANILITADLTFKLADFGTAAKVDIEDEIPEGDRRYMSLELMEGSYNKSQLDKTDVFSLGASVYEMHLGKELPDNGMNWHMLRQGELEFGNIALHVQELIRATMHPDCDSRPSADGLINAIKALRPNAEVARLKEELELKDQRLHDLCSLLQQLGHPVHFPEERRM